jgi:hypothetical protein
MRERINVPRGGGAAAPFNARQMVHRYCTGSTQTVWSKARRSKVHCAQAAGPARARRQRPGRARAAPANNARQGASRVMCHQKNARSNSSSRAPARWRPPAANRPPPAARRSRRRRRLQLPQGRPRRSLLKASRGVGRPRRRRRGRGRNDTAKCQTHTNRATTDLQSNDCSVPTNTARNQRCNPLLWYTQHGKGILARASPKGPQAAAGAAGARAGAAAANKGAAPPPGGRASAGACGSCPAARPSRAPPAARAAPAGPTEARGSRAQA